MRIATPLALALLLTLPIIWYIGFPRYAFRRTRDILSLILRSTIIILIVLAISGLQVVQAVDKLAVVYLVDVSDSMGNNVQEAQLEFIRESIQNKPPDDEWAIVLFGSNAQPETTFNIVTEVEDFTSVPVTTHTDIANAIQTALSMFPPDATRRIVILSDGQPTRGDTLARAQRAQAAGVEISYVPFFRELAPDVRITNLDAPSRVGENQQFDVSVSIEAEEATPATLFIFSGGSLIHEETINLQSGITRYTLTQTSDTSGFLDFSAQVVIPDEKDDFGENNQLSAFSQVVGPARILLVSSEATEYEHLLPALEQAGLIVDVISPGNLPLRMSGLADYKSVILANVPATDLSIAQMELLDQYVANLGGGLVVIGGPDSFAPGGYYQTPLEETLPVEMQIKDQQRLPQLTIAYLIDRSGSMGATGSSNVSNLELAKKAITLSLSLLQPTDNAAVGTFDTGGAWVVEFQPIFDASDIIRRVNTLRPGGGTDIMAGMQLVRRDIVDQESDRKHIILLTDGGSRPLGLVELAEELFNDFDVTTSIIAIGANPASFLQAMADAGNGNYHRVSSIDQIPTIFTLETVLATRSYLIEDPFTPIVSANSPMIDGIGGFPQLRGYVATTEKAAAQVILRSPEPFADPILASWQYGLGRAVVYTGDATARWGANWIQWGEFSRFWGQTISWTINESATSNLETRVIMENAQARIIVDARNDDGTFLNGLNLNTSLLNPEGESQRLPLQQVAPGRYEAVFTPNDEGAYFLTVNGSGIVNGTEQSFNDVNGWVMSYSSEYLQSDQNETLLARIADATGGTSFVDNPEGVFAHTLGERTATAPIYPLLLIIAMLILPFDIAVRRLIITRSDLQRLRASLFGGNTDVDERSERLNTLLSARQRVRERMDDSDVSPKQPIDAPRTPRRPTPAPPSRPTASPSSSAPPEEGNIGSRLLKRKKSRQETDD